MGPGRQRNPFRAAPPLPVRAPELPARAAAPAYFRSPVPVTDDLARGEPRKML
ncbi:rCG42701 [Rattus norvegicus]|uniref:RCG42701 n=1 Tax=Rattus norvegicus TaxID=10116 RepID=A6K1Y0_RAT|nr:rCG42701 [Rattus norvegicus]